MKRISKESSAICFFAFISTVLLLKYRNTSGDIDLYTQAGKLILKGQNPYLNSEFANSPVGAVLVYFISLSVPSKIFPILIQLLNVLGIIFFAKFLQKESPNPYWFYGLIWLALSIPYRALIADVQVSGIVLGLVVVAVYMKNLDRQIAQFLGYVLVCAAVELKPQFALPFALIFWVKHWNRYLFILSGISFVIFHTLLSFKFGKVIEVLWLDKLSKYSNKSLLPGPEISVWKLLNHVINQGSIIRHISSILLLCLFAAILISGLKSKHSLFLLAAIGPIINPYSHMYDLVVLVLLVGMSTKFSLVYKGPALLLFMVPPAMSQTFLIAPMLVLLAFLVVAFVTQGVKYSFSPALYSFVVLLAAHKFSGGDIELELSIRLCGLIPLFLILFRTRRGLNAKSGHF